MNGDSAAAEPPLVILTKHGRLLGITDSGRRLLAEAGIADHRAWVERVLPPGRTEPSAGAPGPNLLVQASSTRSGVVLLQLCRPEPCADCRAVQQLTSEERAVVEYAAQGLSSSEIAAELTVSRRSVERLFKDARTRVGARSRPQLAYLVGRAAACCGLADMAARSLQN